MILEAVLYYISYVSLYHKLCNWYDYLSTLKPKSVHVSEDSRYKP